LFILSGEPDAYQSLTRITVLRLRTAC